MAFELWFETETETQTTLMPREEAEGGETAAKVGPVADYGPVAKVRPSAKVDHFAPRYPVLKSLRQEIKNTKI